MASGRVHAEGDLDFRGTLGVNREVAVGFSAIRLSFEIDTDANDERLARLRELTERYCVVYPARQAPDQRFTDRLRSALMADATTQRKIRVVVAKPGLDGHDRGAKIIARALRDAGMEVIYTGLHQTPEQIVETVIQEDADAVGLSVLSGAHMTLVPRIVELLAEQDIDDVLVTVGGTIPADDIPQLKELGVAEVFTPGASTQEIVDFLQARVTP